MERQMNVWPKTISESFRNMNIVDVKPVLWHCVCSDWYILFCRYLFCVFTSLCLFWWPLLCRCCPLCFVPTKTFLHPHIRSEQEMYSNRPEHAPMLYMHSNDHFSFISCSKHVWAALLLRFQPSCSSGCTCVIAECLGAETRDKTRTS